MCRVIIPPQRLRQEACEPGRPGTRQTLPPSGGHERSQDVGRVEARSHHALRNRIAPARGVDDPMTDDDARALISNDDDNGANGHVFEEHIVEDSGVEWGVEFVEDPYGMRVRRRHHAMRPGVLLRSMRTMLRCGSRQTTVARDELFYRIVRRGDDAQLGRDCDFAQVQLADRLVILVEDGEGDAVLHPRIGPDGSSFARRIDEVHHRVLPSFVSRDEGPDRFVTHAANRGLRIRLQPRTNHVSGVPPRVVLTAQPNTELRDIVARLGSRPVRIMRVARPRLRQRAVCADPLDGRRCVD